MNEEEKKVEKQEQLFDLGNGRFVDVNKLILVAQQDDNQDLYTSSWSLGSRRNAIKTSINETLQAIKDGVVTGRNANKTYNFNKDILQQTGKRFDPNSAALDYLNWIFDSEQAPADFYTQPKPKEEPKKEGPKKYNGSYEETLSKLFPSMEVWNARDADDTTGLISANTNRMAQAREAAKKHLASHKGYDFSESIYQNEQAFEDAMNAIINAGDMDSLITAMSRTGGFKGVNSIQDTYFGIPKVEEKPVVVETEEQKAYREKQEQYKLFLELQNRNKEMAKMDWDMGYYTNNIVPNFIKFSNTSNLPELTQGELSPYFMIPKGVGKDKENEYKLKLEKFADNAHKTLLKYLSGTPINWNQNISEQLTKYLNWYFDSSEESNKEFGRGYYWNPELINKDNAHFYVYNPETRHLLVKSFDEAPDEIKAILEEHHRNKFYNNYGKKLNGGTLNNLKQLRNGGTIKAQAGRTINYVYESDYIKQKKEERRNDPNLEDPNWVNTTDVVGALADLSSLIMSFTGIGSFWSAVPGVIGSSLDFAGNWGRDGLDWKDARNFAINLGSDALGMIPGLGVSSKVAKVSKALPTIITSLAALNVGLDSLNILKKVQDNNGDWSIVTSDDWSNLAQSVLPAIGGVGRMIGNRKASNRILAGMDRGKSRQEALDIIEKRTKGVTKGGTKRILNFTQENKKFEDLMDVLFGTKKVQTPKTRLDELKEISTKFKSNALSKWESDGGSIDLFDEMFKHLVEKGKSEKEALDFISKEMKSNTIGNVFKRVMEVESNKKGGKLNQLKALREGGILKFLNPAGTLPTKEWDPKNKEFEEFAQQAGMKLSPIGYEYYYYLKQNNPEASVELLVANFNSMSTEDFNKLKEQLNNVVNNTTQQTLLFLPEELKYFKYAGIDPSLYGSVSEFRNSENYLQYLNSNFNTNQELKEQASNAIAQTVNPSNLGSSGTGNAGTWRHVGGVKYFDGTSYTDLATKDFHAALDAMNIVDRTRGLEALKAAGSNVEAWNLAFNKHFGDINKNIVGYNPEVDNFDGVSTQFRLTSINSYKPTAQKAVFELRTNPVDGKSTVITDPTKIELADKITTPESLTTAVNDAVKETYERSAAGKRPNVGGEDLYKKVSGLYDLALLGIKNDAIADYANEMSDLYLDNVFRPTAHQIQAPKVTNLFELRMLKQQQDAQDFYKVGQNLSALNPDLYRLQMLGLVSSLANSDMQFNVLERAHLDQLYLNLAEVDNTNAKARLDAYLEGLKNQLSANVTTGAMLAEANKAILNNWGDYMTQLKLNQQQNVKDWNAALYANEVDKANLDYLNAVNYANLHLADDPVAWLEHVNKATNALATLQSEQRNKMYGFKTKPTGPNFSTLSAKKGGKLDSETKLQIENSRFLSKQIIQLLKNRDKGLDRLSKITYKTILKSLGLE